MSVDENQKEMEKVLELAIKYFCAVDDLVII